MMEKQEFYDEVGAILGVGDIYVENLPYRRRWGQRKPGNGRYEGYGIVRYFGTNLVHIAFHGLNGTYHNPDEALIAIRDYKETP
jgi:hypothetical protein